MTEKQRTFTEHYLKSGNALRSAMAAGCTTKRSAASASQDYLDHSLINQAIQTHRRIRAFRVNVRADEVVNELAKLAGLRGNFADCTFDEAGRPVVTSENEHLWSCVRPSDIVTRKYKDRTETSVKVRISSQAEALRMLMAWLGMTGGEGGEDSVRPPTVVVVGVDAAAITGARPAGLSGPVIEVEAD